MKYFTNLCTLTSSLSPDSGLILINKLSKDKDTAVENIKTLIPGPFLVVVSFSPEGNVGVVHQILNYTPIPGLAVPTWNTYFPTDSTENLMENVDFHTMSPSISSLLTNMSSTVLKKIQETMDS